MAWPKQELEYEAERNIALDLTVKVFEDHVGERQNAKTKSNSTEVVAKRKLSENAINSKPVTFPVVEDTSLYCVGCKLSHDGDCSEHGPRILGDNSKAPHDDSSIYQITTLPSILSTMSEMKNKQHFGSDMFPVDKRKKDHILIKKEIQSTVVADIEELNNIADPRLAFSEELMDSWAYLDETLCVFETPAGYTQDVSHIHLSDVLLACAKGNQLYEIETSFKLHSSVPFRTQRTTPTLKSSFICSDKKEIFNSSGNIKREKEPQSGVKLHKCTDCGGRFMTVTLLIAHKGVCTRKRPYKCDICGVGFCVKSSLVTHIRIHTGEKPYKCDICGACFTVNSSLVSHIRTHTGEKPYKCDICGVGFTVSSGLRTHTRIHTGERPYKCDMCGNEFTCCSSLKSHKRIHTGEKPYRCDICGVGFPVNGSLKSHKRIHTGEKPYRCDICGVGFTVSTSLSSHRRIHTGEKPYKCDICGIDFTRNGHLQRHKKMHQAGEL